MRSLESILQLAENGIKQTGFPIQPSRLYDPARYILNAGGKRIRPAISLISSQLFTDDLSQCLDIAVAMEVFHNFTLVHDDIMDKAPLRRGIATVHEKWDISTAILSGDAMLIKSYMLIAGVRKEILPNVLSMFNDTASKVCEGQQFDMDFESQADVTLDAYITMITYKTAVLLGCCLYCGALAADAPMQDATLLYDAGLLLGISFQIQDDVLDAYGDAIKFGKKPGGDILRNKKTYLTLRALELMEEEDREDFQELISSQYLTEEVKISNVLTFFEKYKIKKEAEKAMQKYYDLAIGLIHRVQVAEERKSILLELTESIFHRDR